MSDKLRELVEEVAEIARTGELPDGDGVDMSVVLWAERFSSKLKTLLPTEPVARDGWLLDGNLIYKLSEDRNPCNTHEVRVTQWSGSREKRDCDAAANVLFCNSFNTTPTEPAPDREDALTSLLREVCDELEGVGCAACMGSYSPMEDLHGRIANFIQYNAARQEQA